METIKKTVSTVISTPIGSIGGALALYYAAKKYAHVEKKWALIGSAVIGALLGSAIEYKVRAKFHRPTITPGK